MLNRFNLELKFAFEIDLFKIHSNAHIHRNDLKVELEVRLCISWNKPGIEINCKTFESQNNYSICF